MAEILINDLAPYNQYTATAGQTVFDYTFPIFNEDDLVVVQESGGVPTTLIKTTHYTVSGVGVASGGAITLVTGATVGDTVTMYRNMAVERTSDYQQAGDLYAAAVNNDLDRIVMLIQQNERDIARAIRLPIYDDSGINTVLPTPVADGYFKLNSTGTEILFVPASSGVSDAASVTYTPAGVGVVSTTVQAKLREIVSVADFGAVGDGVTDDSAAIQKALNYIVSLGRGKLVFGAGDYLLNTVVAVTTSAQEIKIEGAGVEVTRLIVPDTNSSGALSLTFTDRTSQVTVEGMTILADGEACGTGLKIVQPEGGNRHNRTVYLKNIEVKGVDITLDYFDTCIDLTGCWRPLVDGVATGGPFGPGVSDDWADAAQQFKGAVGIDLDDCYGPDVINCYVWAAATGISSVTSGVAEEEGIRITNTNIVGVKTAIKFTRTGQEPSFWINNCHINWRDRGLNISGCKLLRITGVISYNEDTGNEYSGTAVDFLFDNISQVIISENIFHYAGATDRINIQTVSTTAADGIFITGNVFNATCNYGVWLAIGTTNALLAYNEWPGTFGTAKINDASNAATIIDRSSLGGVTQTNQADNSASGPKYELFRDSASPAASDTIGRFVYSGNNSAGAVKEYASHSAIIEDPTSTSEDAQWQLYVQAAGTLTKYFSILAAPGSAETAMYLMVNDGAATTLRRVSVGAANSGGTGYRYLRVPN